MRNKFFAILTIIMIGCGSLAFAGGQGEEEGGPPKTTVIKWHTQQSPGRDNALVLEKVNEYLLDELNVTVDLITTDEGTFDQKASVVLASGEQSDLMWTSNHRNDVFVNVSKGAFQPIEVLLDEHAPGIRETVPDFAWGAVTVNDHIYAVPSYESYTMDPVLLLRKDVVDSVGADMSGVETMFDLPPVFDAILEEYPDRIMVDASKGWFLSYPIAGSYDRVEKYSTVGTVLGETDVTAQFYTDFGKQLLQTAEVWYEAGYFDPDVAAVTDTSGDRKSGKMIGWFTFISYEGQGSDGMESTYGVEAYEIPADDDPPKVATATVCGNMQAVPVSAEYPDEAIQVLELVYTDEYLHNLIVYGVKDRHYTVNGDGQLARTENALDYSQFSIPFNMTTAYVPEAYPSNYVELVEEYNASGKVSPLMGFTYDSSETTDLLASCKSVWSEYFVALAGGMLDYGTAYPEFVAKMEQAGVLDLIADVQSQVDEFLLTQ
jgi:putative aldouronate transport system substrate-binding protein